MINKYYRDTLSDPGAASADLAVDPKTMSVSGILCTASIDADGDSIEPAGIILDRHRSNPVVCLNHRSKDLPVGKAEDANGNYTVRVKDYKLVHTAFFHDNALGTEVFKMYEARVLRGWSIAFVPLQMGMMPPPQPGRKRGSRITAGELMEYSAVTIPNNPETLAAYLGKGFHPDTDAILRPMFEPFAAKLKEWANGWTPPARPIVRPASAAAVAKSIYGPRLTARAIALKAFDPNEPRDADGKWTSGGGTSKKKDKLKTPAERYNVLGTRSPEFKAWFGDWEADAANASKVVDKSGAPAETHSIAGVGSKVVRDGKPVAVYHGTPKGGFQAFDKSKLKSADNLLYGQGFYFTEDRSVAQQYEGYEHRNMGMFAEKEKAEKSLETNRQLWTDQLLKNAESVDFTIRYNSSGNTYAPWEIIAHVYEHPQPELSRPVTVADLPLLKSSLELMSESLQKFGDKSPYADPDGYGKNAIHQYQSKIEEYEKYPHRITGELSSLTQMLTDEWDVAGYRQVILGLRDALGVSLAKYPHETKEVYLSIKKPFDVDADWQVDDVAKTFGPDLAAGVAQKRAFELHPELADKITWDAAGNELLKQAMATVKSVPGQVVYDAMASRHGKKAANEWMARVGYDGITHIGGRIMGRGHLHRVWIAFEPTQIKAVANAGTFDPNDPNINKSAAEILARLTA